MTPPATARSTQRAASGSRSAVRHPRRVSGPARVTRSGAAAAVAIPTPGIALPRERPRPSVQPRRRPVRKPARRGVRGESPGIALRAAGALESISASALFDRLIRGRLWIGLLAFALIGMVAMQLLVLKLNTGIGHTLEHVAQLQRENAQLGIEDSTYSAEDRVAPSAAAAGMTLAPPGTVHFVAAGQTDVSRAANALAAPIQVSAGEAEGSSESSSAASGAPQGSAATAETGGSVESSAPAESSVSSSGSQE